MFSPSKSGWSGCPSLVRLLKLESSCCDVRHLGYDERFFCWSWSILDSILPILDGPWILRAAAVEYLATAADILRGAMDDRFEMLNGPDPILGGSTLMQMYSTF